jgi:TIR domain
MKSLIDVSSFETAETNTLLAGYTRDPAPRGRRGRRGQHSRLRGRKCPDVIGTRSLPGSYLMTYVGIEIVLRRHVAEIGRLISFRQRLTVSNETFTSRLARNLPLLVGLQSNSVNPISRMTGRSAPARSDSESMSPRIFISYSSVDQKVAETICAALEARDYPCWISCRDIGAGENFQESIVKAIRSAKVMLLVFTGNANNSNEIKKELVLAGRYHVTVVPLRVEDVVPNDAFAYEFATRQWIDLFKDWEREIGRLTSQIGSILAEETASHAGHGAAEEKSSSRVLWPASIKRFPLRPLLLLSTLAIVGLGLGGAYLYTQTVAPLPSPDIRHRGCPHLRQCSRAQTTAPGWRRRRPTPCRPSGYI